MSSVTQCSTNKTSSTSNRTNWGNHATKILQKCQHQCSEPASRIRSKSTKILIQLRWRTKCFRKLIASSRSKSDRPWIVPLRGHRSVSIFHLGTCNCQHRRMGLSKQITEHLQEHNNCLYKARDSKGRLTCHFRSQSPIKRRLNTRMLDVSKWSSCRKNGKTSYSETSKSKRL